MNKQDQPLGEFIEVRKPPELLAKEFADNFAQPSGSKHLVFMIPGASSNALWTDNFKTEVGISSMLIFRRCGHFEIPFFSDIKDSDVNSFCEHIEKQMLHEIAQHPGATVSILAHSFGTQVACKLVTSKLKDFSLYAVIFLGSIVARRQATSIASRCQYFINDCGTKDHVVVLAEAAYPESYSATGNFGFQSPACTDRYFPTGHSGTTTKEHFKKYIRPLFLKVPKVQFPKKMIQPHFKAWYPKALGRIGGRRLRWIIGKL